MKKIFFNIGALLIMSLLFSACSKEVKPSNIVRDTSMLKPSPYKEGAHYYLKPGTDFKKYNKIIVPDIPIVKGTKSDPLVDDQVLIDTSNYFRKALEAKLNNVISKNPGQGSLTVEVAITSVGKEYKDLKLYEYIPIGLAIAAVSRGAGIVDKNLVIVIAVKFIDTKTKEVIAIVVDSDVQEGFESDQEITFKDIKPSLDKWIEHYQVKLNQLQENKLKL